MCAKLAGAKRPKHREKANSKARGFWVYWKLMERRCVIRCGWLDFGSGRASAKRVRREARLDLFLDDAKDSC